jgi:hypothetical protein
MPDGTAKVLVAIADVDAIVKKRSALGLLHDFLLLIRHLSVPKTPSGQKMASIAMMPKVSPKHPIRGLRAADSTLRGRAGGAGVGAGWGRRPIRAGIGKPAVRIAVDGV